MTILGDLWEVQVKIIREKEKQDGELFYGGKIQATKKLKEKNRTLEKCDRKK